MVFVTIKLYDLAIMKINTYPTPSDLRYFQEIAQTENLSRAAERLGVAQPTLSLSLKRLEEQLNVELFSRKNKGLILTDAGRRLLKECNKLLANWESIVSETQNSQTEIKGRYTLGCHPSVALYTLDPFMRDFYSEYPGIEIHLIHGLSRIICEKVVSGQIDFGIVVNPTRHPDLVLHKLGTDEVCFWKRTAGGLSDVLIYNHDLIQSQSMIKKIRSPFFERTIVSDNLEVMSVLARSGAGVAILPTRVVGAIAPELTKVPNMPTYRDEIYFLYRFDKEKSLSTKCIIDKMKRIKLE